MSKYYRHEDIVGMIEEGFSIDTDEDKVYVIDELLQKLPTIEVSEGYENGKADRPQGEWIDRSDGGRILNPWWEYYECNRCGYYGSGTWNFCPRCGAKMK